MKTDLEKEKKLLDQYHVTICILLMTFCTFLSRMLDKQRLCLVDEQIDIDLHH